MITSPKLSIEEGIIPKQCTIGQQCPACGDTFLDGKWILTDGHKAENLANHHCLRCNMFFDVSHNWIKNGFFKNNSFSAYKLISSYNTTPDRLKLLNILGCKCIDCDVINPKILEIDHILDNGNKDRQYEKNWYTKYINDPETAKKELRVRCLNHHYLRHRDVDSLRPIKVFMVLNDQDNTYEEVKQIKLSKM